MTSQERRKIVRTLRWLGNPITGLSLLAMLFLLANPTDVFPMYTEEGGRSLHFYFLVAMMCLGVLLLFIAVLIYHKPKSEAELRQEASEAYQRKMAEKAMMGEPADDSDEDTKRGRPDGYR